MKTEKSDFLIDTGFEITIKEKNCNFDNSWVKMICDMDYEMTNFEKQLIKDAFNKSYGLQSCLKSVRTQKDAIIALSERTGLRKNFIETNLEQIINL